MHKNMKLLSLLVLVTCLGLLGCDKAGNNAAPSTNAPSGATTNK